MLATLTRSVRGLSALRSRTLALSTIAQQVDAATAAELQRDAVHVTTSADGAMLKSFYPQHFNGDGAASWYDMRSGSYVKLSKEDLEKYLPEGVAGETAQEFAFTKQNAWMVRDTTKVLCRLVEEVEGRLKKPFSHASNSQVQGLHSVIELPRLTDRPEWEAAQLEISCYGQTVISPNDELNKSVFPAPVSSSGEAMIHGKGPKSLLERLVKKIGQRDGGVPNKIMLTGPRGAGKSVALTQAVLHARKRGWIAVFIPNAWDHVQSGPYVEPLVGTEESAQSVYDNPVMSANALRDLWKAHYTDLKALPIKNRDALKKYEALLQEFRDKWHRALKVSGRDKLGFLEMRAIVKEEDHYEDADKHDAQMLKSLQISSLDTQRIVTLGDLLNVGLAVSELSGAAFSDVVEELRGVEEVPVLFAVDEFNSWFARSAFSYDDKAITGFDLAVPRAMHFIDTKKRGTEAWTVKNGMCIAATSFRRSEGRSVTFEDVKSSLPLSLRVPLYSHTEYLSALSLYLNGAPIDPSLSLEEFLQFRMHCGSSPRLVRTEAVPFFLPRTIAANDQELRWAMIAALSEEGTEDSLTSGGTDEAEEVDFDADIGYNEDSEGEEEEEEDEYAADLEDHADVDTVEEEK